MKNILVILPTKRDIRELDLLREKYGVNFIYYGKNPRNFLKEFDVGSFINKALEFAASNDICGVIATHDYPASIIGSIIAQKTGLVSPSTDSILLCQHKYYCRQLQKKYLPQSYVESKIINPYKETVAPFDFPFFIKPVKSFMSVMAARINDSAGYSKYISMAKNHIESFSIPLNELIKNYSSFKYDARYLIAEKLLSGIQVTLEAYSFKGDPKIIGIVDSIMHKNTISFKRFDYPSALGSDVKLKMEEIAKRFIKKSGFDNGILNIEFFYNRQDNSIKIIEVNPRMCSQFADLMEKVNGVNTYEVQLLLSLGINPEKLFKERHAEYKCASSFVLRSFKDKIITKLPSKEKLQSLKKIYPDARIEIYGKENQRLSEQLNDMESYRYGIINLGAGSKKELFQKYNSCVSILDFKFT